MTFVKIKTSGILWHSLLSEKSAHAQVYWRVLQEKIAVLFERIDLNSKYELFTRKFVQCVQPQSIRVPGFLSSRPNWLPPPHQLKASVAPLLCSRCRGGGGVTHSLAGKGAWEPARTKGQTFWYTLGTVWYKIPLHVQPFIVNFVLFFGFRFSVTFTPFINLLS